MNKPHKHAAHMQLIMQAAQDKLEDDDTQVYQDHDDALTIAYQSGYYDGKKAAQPAQEPMACIGTNGELMWLNKPRAIYSKPIPLYTTPPQPEQEPVAWMVKGELYKTQQFHLEGGAYANQIPLYATPPQREWIGLTDEDLYDCFSNDVKQAMKNVEEVLKEKNT